MGNGYAQGHADFALDLLRKHAALRSYFGGDSGRRS
jgi:hypothetical protein